MLLNFHFTDTMRARHLPDKDPPEMKQVELSITDDVGDLLESVSARFTCADISQLQSYVYRVGRVRLCKVIKRGMPSITSLGTIMSFDLDPYSNAELHDLLHLLSPLILESEAASFHTILGLLSQHFLSSSFADNLKVVRQIFDHGEDSLSCEISGSNQQLFHPSALNTDSNGTEYHTDGEDEVTGLELEEELIPKKKRSVGIRQLQGKVKALFMLEYIVNLVLDSSREAEIISRGA